MTYLSDNEHEMNYFRSNLQSILILHNNTIGIFLSFN